MATQTIKTCDGIDTCEEQVTASINLTAVRDHTISRIVQLDSCNEHLGEQVAVLWQERFDHLGKYNVERQAEYEKMDDKAKRRHGENTTWMLHDVTILDAS